MPITRSATVLAAIHWINNNRPKAIKLKIANADIDKEFKKQDDDTGNEDFNVEAVERFCDTVGLTSQELIDSGELLKTTSLLVVANKPYDFTPDCRVNLFRSVRENWDQVDGTVFQSSEDTARRYHQFPLWSANSCAIDVVLFAAIMLDVGRCQVDQMTMEQQRGLGRVPLLLRAIVRAPWGEMDTGQLARLRDSLCQELEEHNPGMFRRGAYLSVAEVMDVAFDGLAQVSFTALRGTIDCQGDIISTTNTNLIGRRTGINIMHAMGGWRVAVANYFRLKESGDVEECGTDCEGASHHYKRIIVVDRLPPTLIITLGYKAYTKDAATKDAVHALSFPAQTSREVKVYDFEAVGCIFQVNNNHFIARWRLDGAIVEYDSMVEGQPVSKAGWWEGLPKDSILCIVVFRMVDS